MGDSEFSNLTIASALAALRPRLLAAGVGRAAVMLASFAALAAVVFYWPTADEFWRISVWWETEAAREGMGVMIGLLVLISAWVGAVTAANPG